jgi:two-component system, LytTR family, response regulator
VYKRNTVAVPALRTLIVDDEPVARQVLRELLEIFPEVEVVGEAQNGREALEKVAESRPDLMFLDLQMPVMGGFEVVRALGGDAGPMIVIVTAYDEHAIRGFEAGAVDYLLKPVSEERLYKSVERALVLHNRPIEIANTTAKISAVMDAKGSAGRRKIVGRAGGEYVLLDLDEVLAFQAERELVWIVTAQQRLLSAQSLGVIEARYGGYFQRVHRNAVVNLNHVRKMSPLSSQRWLITLSNSLQIVASKRQAHSIRKILRW